MQTLTNIFKYLHLLLIAVKKQAELFAPPVLLFLLLLSNPRYHFNTFINTPEATFTDEPGAQLIVLTEVLAFTTGYRPWLFEYCESNK